ncbi:hypothetical protein V5O48_007501 [Marasmius crinis-equi]|uniref:Uncharacterized protein n=1 Tax=Marasmius crinis-equi TaxID=585013 RepID=A0ABR3FGH4_9AGAR
MNQWLEVADDAKKLKKSEKTTHEFDELHKVSFTDASHSEREWPGSFIDFQWSVACKRWIYDRIEDRKNRISQKLLKIGRKGEELHDYKSIRCDILIPAWSRFFLLNTVPGARFELHTHPFKRRPLYWETNIKLPLLNSLEKLKS